MGARDSAEPPLIEFSVCVNRSGHLPTPGALAMESQPPRKWSSLRLGAVIFGGFLLLVVVILSVAFAVIYELARQELAAAEAAVRRRGEPVRFVELKPTDEAALVVGDRLRTTTEPFGNWPVFSDEFRELIHSDPPPGDYPAFRRAIERFGPVAAEVVALAQEPACRFRYDYATPCPACVLLPGVQSLGLVRDLLHAEVIQALGTDRPELAAERLADLLDVSELLRHNPFAVSQMVRSRIGNKAVDLLQTTLARTDPDEDQLRALDRRLAENEASFRLARAVQCERAVLITMLDNLGNEENRNLLRDFRDDFVIDRGGAAWRLRWWDSVFYRPRVMEQQVLVLRCTGQIARHVDRPGPAAQKALDRILADLTAELRRRKPSPVSRLFPALGRCRPSGLTYRQRLLTARLALRVDRFRAEHGRLPERLEQVLDEALAEVPRGLFLGALLRLEIDDNGFTIAEPGAEVAQDDGLVPPTFALEYPVE
jgi:hypothetical protein